MGCALGIEVGRGGVGSCVFDRGRTCDTRANGLRGGEVLRDGIPQIIHDSKFHNLLENNRLKQIYQKSIDIV